MLILRSLMQSLRDLATVYEMMEGIPIRTYNTTTMFIRNMSLGFLMTDTFQLVFLFILETSELILILFLFKFLYYFYELIKLIFKVILVHRCFQVFLFDFFQYSKSKCSLLFPSE